MKIEIEIRIAIWNTSQWNENKKKISHTKVVENIEFA